MDIIELVETLRKSGLDAERLGPMEPLRSIYLIGGNYLLLPLGPDKRPSQTENDTKKALIFLQKFIPVGTSRPSGAVFMEAKRIGIRSAKAVYSASRQLPISKYRTAEGLWLWEMLS